jgi:hypothetical protein
MHDRSDALYIGLLPSDAMNWLERKSLLSSYLGAMGICALLFIRVSLNG